MLTLNTTAVMSRKSKRSWSSSLTPPTSINAQFCNAGSTVSSIVSKNHRKSGLELSTAKSS
jgi:hypothetical protein